MGEAVDENLQATCAPRLHSQGLGTSGTAGMGFLLPSDLACAAAREHYTLEAVVIPHVRRAQG